MTDPVLTGLLRVVQRDSAVQLPITLLSHGVVVEGLLVGDSRWHDEVARALDGVSDQVQVLADAFRENGLRYEMAAAVGDKAIGRIHLLEAVLRSGGQVVSVGMWSIETTAVDGWKLGSALPRPNPLRAVEG